MGIKHFFLIFGITPTVCSRVVNQMLTLVVQKLNRQPSARKKSPNVDKMESFTWQINRHEPEVDDVIGFMDGLVLISECTLERIEQKSM